MIPRPAADCHLYLVDAEGVLFCEGQQEIHALNTTAAFVWLALEDGGDEESIAQELSDHFGVSPQQTRQALGEGDQYEPPRAGLAQPRLELGAEARVALAGAPGAARTAPAPGWTACGPRRGAVP